MRIMLAKGSTQVHKLNLPPTIKLYPLARRVEATVWSHSACLKTQQPFRDLSVLCCLSPLQHNPLTLFHATRPNAHVAQPELAHLVITVCRVCVIAGEMLREWVTCWQFRGRTHTTSSSRWFLCDEVCSWADVRCRVRAGAYEWRHFHSRHIIQWYHVP